MEFERRVIIAFVACVFALVGLLGWHYTQPRTDRICSNPAAQCGDRPYAGAP
jgi:hypothetical protein